MKKMKNRFAKSLLVAGSMLLGAGLISSCVEETANDRATTIRRDSLSVRGDTTAQHVAPPNGDPGLTLPVLNALFYEEGFEQELKSKLALTDAQVAKLKTISQESVADLDEGAGTGDYAGSTRAATKRSEEQLKAAIGDDKVAQLYQLINQRYGGGDIDGLVPTKPNEVPTDTRIVVNAPAYRMDVFQEGKLLKSYRVGIGYPEFPLPAGMRRAETIIFNPTWTPPDEPWVKGKFKPGEKVEAGSKDNPLGPIKIPIGLPSLIHGGKALAKLGNFASHGCVGLTNAQVQDFAGTLAQISGSQLTPEDIQGYGKNKSETKSVKLAKPVPIDLRYETIVAEAGGLRIYRDVYERGTNTVENARKVLEAQGASYDQLPEPEKQALIQALTEMNRDPQGNAIVADIGAGPSTDSAAADDPTKSAKAKKGKVTYSVVGRKEVAVPIAALQGKGYPAPVNLNTGGAPAKATASVTRR